MQTVQVAMREGPRECGLTKLGITPGGGGVNGIFDKSGGPEESGGPVAIVKMMCCGVEDRRSQATLLGVWVVI